YHQLGVQLFFIITISVFVLLFVFRIATDYGFMSVLKKKRKLSLGLLLLTAAFFLGGLGYSQYDPQNIVYCAVLFVVFSFCISFSQAPYNGVMFPRIIGHGWVFSWALPSYYSS
ncbi:MAG: hypothetical protein IKC91_05455, partial [Clostridia bacterium]|nr:hypothetical protein [Clostridia bacterium]